MCFHKRVFIYAAENFPLNDGQPLEKTQFLNFLYQKFSFEDVCALANKLSYVSFTIKKNQMNEMEQKFLLLETLRLDDFEDYVNEDARTDQSGEAVTYRSDILWYYLNEFKVPGTQKSKFGQLFRLAKVVLTIVHSHYSPE